MEIGNDAETRRMEALAQQQARQQETLNQNSPLEKIDSTPNQIVRENDKDPLFGHYTLNDNTKVAMYEGNDSKWKDQSLAYKQKADGTYERLPEAESKKVGDTIQAWKDATAKEANPKADSKKTEAEASPAPDAAKVTDEAKDKKEKDSPTGSNFDKFSKSLDDLNTAIKLGMAPTSKDKADAFQVFTKSLAENPAETLAKAKSFIEQNPEYASRSGFKEYASLLQNSYNQPLKAGESESMNKNINRLLNIPNDKLSPQMQLAKDYFSIRMQSARPLDQLDRYGPGGAAISTKEFQKLLLNNR